VILEVDEYAHTSTGYTPEADMARMRKIQECLGTPHTFIRYNPDEYVTEGVKLDPSPAERHRVLLDTVQSCLATSPSEMRVVYLFYDTATLARSWTWCTRADISRRTPW
jgi:hypothetical protein